MDAFFVLILALQVIAITNARPTVGIIRWDAWNQVSGSYDEISFYVQNDMSPTHWHYRLPFFASTTPNVSFNNANQSIIDQEIQYAHSAGIDYFAFDTYCKYGKHCATNSTLCQFYCNTTSHDYCPEDPSYGLDLYLTSKYKHLINFTLILLGSMPCDSSNIARYIELMKQDTFQTVLNNRPLIYLFQFQDNEAEQCGGWNSSKMAFDKIRKEAMNNGLNNPYFVYMLRNIKNASINAQKLGFDAISSYAMGGGSANGDPFIELVNNATYWWHTAAVNKYTLVPLIPTGWDPRPRAENPPPWTHEGPRHYLQPTALELQQFVRDCINFTCNYQNGVTETQTMIMYAWNECSENGACVIPTIGNGTLYIDALSKVLPSEC